MTGLARRSRSFSTNRPEGRQIRHRSSHGITRAAAAFVVGISLITAGAGWKLLFSRPDSPPGLEPATVSWLAQHAPGEAALGLPGNNATEGAVQAQAASLVLGPLRPRESVLWLEALGVRHIVSNQGAKYGPLLDAEYEDDAGYRVYRVPVNRPAEALLVSREEWRRLPAFRSLYDRAALSAYVQWANRPEAAGVRRLQNGSMEIHADLGPNDVILLRQSRPGKWVATAGSRPVSVVRDPIGNLVLDPGISGPVVMQLAHQSTVFDPLPFAAKQDDKLLPVLAIPSIDSGGIIDGVSHTPPPVAPAGIISIFGSDFAAAGPMRVLVNGRPMEVLFAGTAQINARLPGDLPPGPVEIVVETPQGRSDPALLEIEAK